MACCHADAALSTLVSAARRTVTNRARASVLALAWCLFGCGSSADGHLTLIGATCERSEECDVLGVCVTDGKGGLCASPCRVPGGAQQCPLGAYCDRASLTTDINEMSEMTLCLPACDNKTACRDGYECKDVNGGPGKVCRPK
jgi:hypothetical protein